MYSYYFVNALLWELGNGQAVLSASSTTGFSLETQGSTALFGSPSSRFTEINGKLVYIDGNICEKGTYDQVPLNYKGDQEGDTFFLVKTNAQCSYVQMVRRAQEEKAQGVLVISDTQMDTVLGESTQVMGDADEDSKDILIPSILLAGHDGEKLRQEIREHTLPLTVKLSWAYPKNSYCSTDVYVNLGTVSAVEFMGVFGHLARDVFEDKIHYSPHYAVTDVHSLYGSANPPPTFVDQNCRDDSRFCVLQDSGSLIPGQDLVQEVARQLCLIQHVSNWRKSRKYWNYVLGVLKSCIQGPLVGNADWDPDCYATQFFGLTTAERAAIDQCTTGPEADVLLEAAKDGAMDSRSTAVQLNGILVPFSLNQRTIGEEICSTFQPKPSICAEGYQEKLYREIILKVSGRLTWVAFLSYVALCLFLVTGLLYLYRRHMRSRINNMIREEVMLSVYDVQHRSNKGYDQIPT